ncbi:MAG: AMP-binding protein [Chlorobi bacterium]|nr:AMP-binding protein [Chlorobiota bacterium]
MNVFDYLFENWAGYNNDFVLGPGETISYSKLYNESIETARGLFNQFGENNPIFLISENSVFFIKSYLAILKSGNICIPVNPSLEKENLRKIVELAETKKAFISPRNLRKFEDFSFTILNGYLNGQATSDVSGFEDMDIAEFDENRTAEIIFTSGSTGEQKGVMISHKNIIANTSSIIEYLKLSQNDIVQVVLPFHYCYGLSLLHTHLKVGGSVVLNNSFMFLGTIINDLKKYKCTGFAGVPSHFQILLRKSKDFKDTHFPHLKYVTQAGGKLHTSFIREFVSAFPDIDFYVMYGQTEATARLSYLPPKDLKKKTGSIGKGIPGVELKVVDKKGKPVKAGEVGEIIAKGENIMQGYFKDKKATMEVLREGWLHTGDLASIDDDGFIYIKSREKEILKVRGIRISPKEIEEVIVGFPGVIDCTIHAISDDITGEAIKAIVYVNDGDLGKLDKYKIQQFCAKHLSRHKIPKEIEFDTKLTFNTSGKRVK